MANDRYNYPKTAKEAKANGLKLYSTGRKCANGHSSVRYSSNSMCVECSKMHRDNEPESDRLERQKSYYAKNAEKMREKSSLFHKKNRNKILSEMRERNKKYYSANSDKIKAAVSKYRKENPEWRKAYASKWNSEKRATDENFAMSQACRRMLHRVTTEKNGRTSEQLGYSASDLASHLEAQFSKGMTWGNYGSHWHIDHIVPIKKLIQQGIKDPAVINCLSNLMPLGAKENMSKGAKDFFLI